MVESRLPQLLSPRQVAFLLGVHYETVLRWITKGYIPATRLGNLYFVDLDNLIERLATPINQGGKG